MNEKVYITTGQLFTLFFVSKISLTILYSSQVSGTNNIWDMFLPLLLAMVLMFILILPSVFLFGKDRSDSVFGISRKVFGKSGNAVPVLYGLYFAVSFLYSGYVLKDFLDTMLNDEIQSGLVVAAFVAAAVYAAAKGIEALSRMSSIILFLFLLGAVLVFSFLFPNYSSENLVPSKLLTLNTVFDGGVFIMSRMNTAAAINIFAPNTKGKIFRGSYLWIFVTFLLTAFMLILSFGSVGDYINTRSMQVYSVTDGSGALQRLNPLFLLISSCCVFCNMSLMLLSFAECAKSVMKKISRTWITIVSGAFLLAVLLLTFNIGGVKEMIFNKYIWCISGTVFIFLIPFILLAAKKIKSNRKMSKRLYGSVTAVLLSFAVVLSVPTLTGCTGTQLNQRLIIQGIGIDKLSDGCKVTLIVLDTDDEEHENATQLIYADGKNPNDAFTGLENERGQSVLLSQCLFIMMNESAADACDDTLSYFVSKNDIQKTTSLMVSKNSAYKTITSAVKDFNYTSEYINVLSDSKEVSQPSAHCSFMDYMSSLKSISGSMLFPYIDINKNTSSVLTDGSYLVDRNGKNFRMNEDETIGTLIVNRKALNFTETLSKGNDKINYSIDNISTSITPSIINNKLNICFNVHIFLDKQYNKSNLKKITESIYKKVNSGINKTVADKGSDVFSVNRYIRSAYPDFYKNINDWNMILKESETNIKVTCC